LSCAQLIDAVRDKASTVVKQENEIMDGMQKMTSGAPFDTAKYCAVAKRRHSADFKRRCTDSGLDLTLAQGFNFEGTLSRGMFKEGLCK
jgi:hypothetical protein